MELVNYSDIKQYRDHHISQVCRDSIQLNKLHEEIYHQVLNFSLKRITEQYGPPPTSFSFFVMGSAGRFEQSVWSDQDHGIIYQNQKDEAKTYFLSLGREISIGLNEVGYPYCNGNVMASNPLWCQSLGEWKQQLANWMDEASWETIRNLLIFIDGRSVFGEHSYIQHLKEMVLQTVHQKKLLPKILSNTMYMKKGVSVLGQILVETHGTHSGAVNSKEIAILPYVNAVRLLAFKERILESSTLSRMELLPKNCFLVQERSSINNNLVNY